MLMLLALLAAADPAPTTTAPATATPAAPAKERKVCRSEDNIGSLVPRRVCRTSAEWKQIGEVQAAHNRAEMRSLNSTPGQNPQ